MTKLRNSAAAPLPARARRKPLAPWIALFCLAFAFAAAADPTADRGAAILAPFKNELREALQAGLAEGPAEAVQACRLRAPEIAASQSGDGVRVGRSSHRLRNPANAPPAWVVPAMTAYLADPEDRAPRSVALPDARRGYVEPIWIAPPCLTCHGEALAPAVRARIEALYPADEAVGFELGELRGVFWAEFPGAN